MTPDFQILVTNDDGIHAPGLQALVRLLQPLGRVVAVAPTENRSAISHALTLSSPLRIHRLAEDRYAVDGTPADCVLVAMNKILDGPPGLVLSGINAGCNLGDDVMYSGTVAGAREGSMYGIPAIALSLQLDGEIDYDHLAAPVLEICRRHLNRPLPPGTFLNVNFPSVRPAGVRVTRLSHKFARAALYEKNDPRGLKYYWIGEDESSWDDSPDTDFWAVTHGYVSISPLHRDQTSHDTLRSLRQNYDE